MIHKITNSKFAETNEHFRKACKEAGIEPTMRQASKFRSCKGLAYKYRKRVKST